MTASQLCFLRCWRESLLFQRQKGRGWQILHQLLISLVKISERIGVPGKTAETSWRMTFFRSDMTFFPLLCQVKERFRNCNQPARPHKKELTYLYINLVPGHMTLDHISLFASMTRINFSSMFNSSSIIYLTISPIFKCNRGRKDLPTTQSKIENIKQRLNPTIHRNTLQHSYPD